MASNTAALFTIYLLVVFYALCYQLQAPIEPFLVDKLIGKDEDSAATYGRLGSFFSIVQTVGSLSFGYLLDRAGVRIGFGVNFLCCALTYYILANCTSIEMLYISKLPGIGMAGFLCAQTAVSRITEGEDRIVALGRLTTSYTIGGSLGPYLGGILGSTGDYYVGAKAATVGSLIACVVAFLLPAAVDECKDLTPAKDKKGKKGDSDVPWVGRVKIVLTSVGLLLFIKVATSVANSMAASAQPLILKNSLNFAEADLGAFMSAKFVFGGVANGFLLGPITKALGGELTSVVRNCILMMALTYAAEAVFYHEAISSAIFSGFDGDAAHKYKQYPFIGITLLLSVFQFTLGTSITATTTTLVPADMKGTLIGMEHSLFAVARVFGPTAGVYLLTNGGISGIATACSAAFFAVLGIWLAGAPKSIAPAKKNE